jgi:hypothetical protein
MILKEYLFLVLIIAPFLLVLFTLFIALKKPEILKNSLDNASRDRPHASAGLKKLLSIFYVLDELKNKKGYGPIRILGIIGIISTAMYLIIFTVIFCILTIFKAA